jgi:hypothetical protein
VLLAPGGRAVLESDAGVALALPLAPLAERTYGGTRVTVLAHA